MSDNNQPDRIDRPAWIAHLRTTLAPWAGRGVVVAVSGGGDSVGLLRGLVALGWELSLRPSVACFDHGTRGGESARDAGFVAGLAGQLGLPFDLGHWTSPRAGHFEADARRARYAWLLDVARRRGAEVVAVGHTSDDQAETILHRIVRGTGLSGLAGMAASRPLGAGVTLVRPLLAVTRAEVRAYLAAVGQTWCEDTSNLDQSRTRARIRHDLLPKLAADYNPGVVAALVRLGGLAAAASVQADRRALRRLRRATVSQDGSQIVLDRDALRKVDLAGRVDLIRLAWRQLGWPEGGMSYSRWERLGQRAGGTESGRGEVAAGVEAVATPGEWILRQRVEADPTIAPEPCRLEIPGSAPWLGGRVFASLDDSNPLDEWADLDEVAGPLVVRSARPGDRFAPLGLDGHSQPLADFYRGRGVPRAARPRVPVVADSRGIVWVAGHRIAHRVRWTEATVRTLGLRYEPVAGSR